jgi:hypothetical protein
VYWDDYIQVFVGGHNVFDTRPNIFHCDAHPPNLRFVLFPFTDVTSLLKSQGQHTLNALEKLNLDKLAGQGSHFNIDGSRMNTLDRNAQRLAPLDVTGIRRQSESEGWRRGRSEALMTDCRTFLKSRIPNPTLPNRTSRAVLTARADTSNSRQSPGART